MLFTVTHIPFIVSDGLGKRNSHDASSIPQFDSFMYLLHAKWFMVSSSRCPLVKDLHSYMANSLPTQKSLVTSETADGQIVPIMQHAEPSNRMVCVNFDQYSRICTKSPSFSSLEEAISAVVAGECRFRANCRVCSTLTPRLARSRVENYAVCV